MTGKKRTSIYIPEELIRRKLRYYIETGLTINLSEFVRNALDEKLKELGY